MAQSKCVDKYGTALMAYNALMKRGVLCKELKELHLVNQCPPSPADLNKIDRLILCAIMCCCKNDPNTDKNGNPRYQNCVAATINRANLLSPDTPERRMRPEVTYNMTTTPPKPMGKNAPFGTKESYIDQQPKPGESKNDFEARTGNRRPDVVVTTDPARAPETSNIERIYEFKFPGDSYGPGQEEAYEDIAGGDKSKVVTLTTDDCCGKDEGDGGRVLQQAFDVQQARFMTFMLLLGGGPGGRAAGGAVATVRGALGGLGTILGGAGAAGAMAGAQ